MPMTGRSFFEGWDGITLFGHDWRRSLEEAASQLTGFLADLRDRVKDLRDCDTSDHDRRP